MSERVRFLSQTRLRKGRLEGWHHTQETETRHRHLEEAARRHGWTSVGRSLNALYVADKNRDPAAAEIAHRDSRWAFEHRERHGMRE